MTKQATSLIAEAAEAQALAPAFSFFSEEEREATERLTQAGEFTGERLYRDRPGIYSAIVRMAAEGLSISAAARALGVSRNTVVAVREREGISIEQDKRELMKLLGTARRLSVEKVIELIPDLKSAKDAAITAAVMVDKYALLAGEATSRVERVEVKPDQVQAYLDALPVVDAEFEVISTGIRGETDGQKAVPALALPSPKSDIGSDDIAVTDTDDPAIWATPRTTSLDNTPPLGGGGGPVSIDLPTRSIDSGNQNFGQRAHSTADASTSVAGELIGGAGDRGKGGDVEGGGAGLGGLPATTTLCKRTKKKGGPTPPSSPRRPTLKKAPISKKKKGGSAC
jgi:transposase-like protein